MHRHWHTSRNAVAPDWNLKFYSIPWMLMKAINAVAPDWNLKQLEAALHQAFDANAVAPDWNLKLMSRLSVTVSRA